ncbi:MAG: 50S ribosomal protein L18 [Coriobacteriia bacterium]|nr:50S ribosomal protein L18 [Coriobacteriia bacterium]
MLKTKKKSADLKRRQTRVRGKISGTAQRPRLRVTRTNAHISAQLIDDVTGCTLVAAASNEKGLLGKGKVGSNVEAATLVGETIGARAKDAKITEVVFDRGGRIYHGRVKALAEGARSAGLKF